VLVLLPSGCLLQLAERLSVGQGNCCQSSNWLRYAWPQSCLCSMCMFVRSGVGYSCWWWWDRGCLQDIAVVVDCGT
jgi:hypothetical protein